MHFIYFSLFFVKIAAVFPNFLFSVQNQGIEVTVVLDCKTASANILFLLWCLFFNLVSQIYFLIYYELTFYIPIIITFC